MADIVRSTQARRLIRFLPACLMIPLILAVGCQNLRVHPGSSLDLQAALMEAARDADRMTLSEIAMGIEQPPRPIPMAAASSFFECVKTDPNLTGFRCGCEGTHTARFFRGEKLLVELRIFHGRSIRWINGPLRGEMLLENAGGFGRWQRQQGNRNPFTPTAEIAAETRRIRRATEAFFEAFPTGVRDLLPRQSVVVSGIEPRRIESPLLSAHPSAIDFAKAGFRALGSGASAWLDDDAKTAVVQTALAGLLESDWADALRQSEGDATALSGAARVYFRFRLDRQFSSSFTDEWLPRMAEAELRSGDGRDQPLMLIYLAESKTAAARQFLRELADGRHGHGWSQPCRGRGDVLQEPSLPVSAALMLSLQGQTEATTAMTRKLNATNGLDLVAAAIAKIATDSSQPVRAAYFKYPSRLLGYAAAECLAHQSRATISAAAISAAWQHPDQWVNRRATEVARTLGLDRYRHDDRVSLAAAPVPEFMATESPALAVAECTRHLVTADGLDRVALRLIRAAAYRNLRQTPAAIADFESALKEPGYPHEIIHRELAFLKLELGDLTGADQHAEQSLRLAPDADVFLLRGLIRFASADFGVKPDLYFTAAMALAPNQGYAEIFQHLSALLDRHPERSRLSGQTEYSAPYEARISLNTGTHQLTLNDGQISSWPAAVIRYFKGESTRDQLLGEAVNSDPTIATVQTAEAFFYLSQSARAKGDLAGEKADLEHCLATQGFACVEYQLAKFRLRSLEVPTQR
jgi:tetratricopeptide (TPR) repeat protein